MGLLGYLPGVALGLGLWLGLRWPRRAVKLAALLAVVIALALYVAAGVPGDPALLQDNQARLVWSVLPSIAAFLVALGIGTALRARGGGSME